MVLPRARRLYDRIGVEVRVIEQMKLLCGIAAGVGKMKIIFEDRSFGQTWSLAECFGPTVAVGPAPVDETRWIKV